MMSREENGGEQAEYIVIRPLPWRASRVDNFKSLNDTVQEKVIPISPANERTENWRTICSSKTLQLGHLLMMSEKFKLNHVLITLCVLII